MDMLLGESKEQQQKWTDLDNLQKLREKKKELADLEEELHIKKFTEKSPSERINDLKNEFEYNDPEAFFRGGSTILSPNKLATIGNKFLELSNYVKELNQIQEKIIDTKHEIDALMKKLGL